MGNKGVHVKIVDYVGEMSLSYLVKKIGPRLFPCMHTLGLKPRNQRGPQFFIERAHPPKLGMKSMLAQLGVQVGPHMKGATKQLDNGLFPKIEVTIKKL
jgi:hypothetical protein